MPSDPDTALSLEQWAERGFALASDDGYRALLHEPASARVHDAHAAKEIAVFTALHVRDALDAALHDMDGKDAWRHCPHATAESRHTTRLDAKVMRVLKNVGDQFKYFLADDTADTRTELLLRYSDIYNQCSRLNEIVDPSAVDDDMLVEIVDAAALFLEAIGKLHIEGLRALPAFDAEARHEYAQDEITRFSSRVLPDEIWR